MKKSVLFLLSIAIITGFGTTTYAATERENGGGTSYASAIDIDTETVYYPNATISSIASKFKSDNITGCLQETFSYVKKNPNDSVGYYYMALAYARIGESARAQEAYDKAISLKSNATIVEYATRGKACLTGDSEGCNPKVEEPVKKDEGELTDLDKFIQAPYGNGLSPELNREIKQKELQRLQQEMNNEPIKRGVVTGGAANINDTDIPSNKEILEAIDTLKRAGLQINVSASNSAPEQTDIQKVMNDPEIMSKNAEFAQLNMLLGNGNNNNNSMMNVLPYLFNQDGSVNQNINPRVIETMMTSSMLDAYNNYDNNNKNNF
jgi:tetratricopeptide (TPR) repeat protein